MKQREELDTAESLDPLKTKAGQTPIGGSTGWQERLLPMMRRMVLWLSVFFFTASLVQLLYLHWSIKQGPSFDLHQTNAVLATLPKTSDRDILASYRYQALITLESYALEKRYHQANVLLMSRVWTRYLGFMTGMILSLIGAAFILGKLEGPVSEVEAETSGLKYHLKSASPGIILTGLGVALMLTTIIVHHKIDVVDRPIYTSGMFPTDETHDKQAEKPAIKVP